MIRYTADQQKVADYLPELNLTHGRGSDAQNACSIAAINLALSGKLSDEPTPCMSLPLRAWVIAVQDVMPIWMMQPTDEHGDRWRAALPLVAGTIDIPSQIIHDRVRDWAWRALGGDLVPSWIPAKYIAVWQNALVLQDQRSARVAKFCIEQEEQGTTYLSLAMARAAETTNNGSIDITMAAMVVDAMAGAYASTSVAYNSRSDAATYYWRLADPAGLLLKLCTLNKPEAPRIVLHGPRQPARVGV